MGKETPHAIRPDAPGETALTQPPSQPGRTQPLALAGWSVLALLALALFGVLAGQGVEHSLERDAWRYGDWAINYAGGFVRRGLSGELLRVLEPVAPPPVVLAGLKLALYAVVFGVLTWLAAATRRPAFMFFVFLSPLALGFILFESSLEGRKDLLLIAWMAGFVGLDRVAGLRRPLALATGPALAVVVLCHEGLAVFMWPVWLILVMRARAGEASWAAVILSVLAPAVALAASVVAHGDAAAASAICASLEPWAPAKCLEGGPVDWLGADMSRAMEEMRRLMPLQEMLRQTARAALGFGGLFVLLRAFRVRFEGGEARFWAVAAAGLVLAAPVFAVAVDWARWFRLVYTGLAFWLVWGLANGRVVVPTCPEGGRWRLATLTGLAVVLFALFNSP